MTAKLVISALSTDRPGIVNDISTIIYQHKLNIEDSRMTVLGGEFAILLLVGGAQANIEKLQVQLEKTKQDWQMDIICKSTQESKLTQQNIPYQVNVTALDNPGIVNDITNFFAQQSINIINCDTERYHAPHTGTPMFLLNMTVGIPTQINVAELREKFMLFCDALNLDAKLENFS